MSEGQKLFDDTFSEFSDFIAKYIEKAYKKNKNIPEEEQFDLVTDPVMAAILAVFIEYSVQIGYSRGDIMERLWDFYNNAEEGLEEEDDEEKTEEEIKKDIN